MYIVNNYTLAVIFCVVTMLCWGSWGNMQKLASKTWRYEYFYWDYVIGVLLFSILSAFTLGSIGSEGRSFLPDLAQADRNSLGSAFLGGVVFNAANILLAAAIAISGLSVAFPVGIGLALVLGVLVNYFGEAKGQPLFILLGVVLIVVAIVLNGMAYRKMLKGTQKVPAKGIGISIAAGIIMAFFYRFVAASMDLTDFAHPAAGKLTLHGGFRIRSRSVRQQLHFQHDRHEKTGRGPSDPNRRLFPGLGRHAHGRHGRRNDLVSGPVVQHDRVGTGRSGHIVRSGARRDARLRALGHSGMERVPERSGRIETPEPNDVHPVRHRTRLPRLRRSVAGRNATTYGRLPTAVRRCMGFTD